MLKRLTAAGLYRTPPDYCNSSRRDSKTDVLPTAAMHRRIDGPISDTIELRSVSARTPRTVSLLAGLFCLSAAAAAYEIGPASVIPLVERSLGVGPTAAGGLVSVMYATAMVTSLPLGYALDRIGARRAVAAAGTSLLVAGGWGYVAAGAGAYTWVLASRVLGGLSYIVVWNTGATLAGSVVDVEYRATAVGVFTASAPVGFALGQFGSPRIAAVAGWEAILPAYGGFGVVGMMLFLIATRGRPLQIDAAVPDRSALSALFQDRTVWALSTLCFLAFSLYIFLNTWLPSYLAEGLSLSLSLSGLVTALFPAVGVAARTLSGIISDRLFGGRRRPVVVAAFLLAAPAVAGFVVARELAAVLALLVVSGFVIQTTIGLLFTYVTEVVPATVRTTAVALLTSAGMLGAFAAPLAAGLVIEAIGYHAAFLGASVVAVVGVVVAWTTPEPARRSAVS